MSRISLTQEERERFLADQLTLRLATVDPDGAPHVAPLWYVFHDGVIWINTIAGSHKVRNIEADPRACLTVDDGEAYGELRGIVIYGECHVADGDPELETIAPMFGEKYFGDKVMGVISAPKRTWLKFVPGHWTSWDFRKI